MKKFAELRKQAELILKTKSKQGFTNRETDLLKVFDELDTFQIELELQLQDTHKQLKKLYEQLQLTHYWHYEKAPVGYITLDKKNVIKEVNQTCINLLGLSKTQLLEHPFTDIIHPDDQDIFYFCHQALMQSQNIQSCELRLCSKSKQLLWVKLDCGLKQSPQDIQLHIAISDVTEKHIAKLAEAEQHKFLQSIIDGIHDPVMVIDTEYNVKLMNAKVRDGMDPNFMADITQPKCYEVSHYQSKPCDGKDHICPLAEVIRTQRHVSIIHNHPDPSGEKHYVELSSSPLWDRSKNFIGVIESARDITAHLLIQDELREQKDILSFQANHDALTQLPNRLLLMDRIEQSIKKASRHKKKIAILFIDLDHFKEINDSLGHNIGDEVLIQSAARLKLCVRQSDTVARLGGDEFTVIVDEIQDDDIIIDIINKITLALQKAFMVETHKLHVTSSIGISLYPEDAQSADDLLRNADTAMYKAKDEGRNTYRFYTEDMTQRAIDHILMESNLHHALANNQISVFYQPQVNGNTHQIIGMEALVRWQHPELGLISPDKFIPLAEKTGLIIPLGEQIFDIATKQIPFWKQKYNIPGRMAINLSVKQFQQKNIAEVLFEKLKQNQCNPEHIELEITENYILDNPKRAINTLQKFQDAGIEIAIDDFGTGYSSLAYLKKLPVNKLKIDKSFIDDLEHDENDKVIIKSTIFLALNMKLNVIAEGVETKQQRDFLLEHGCEMIQGYYYSRPLAESEMTKLLRSGKPLAN